MRILIAAEARLFSIVLFLAFVEEDKSYCRVEQWSAGF